VLARAVSALLGAPIPDHVVEMFHRGRLADNSRMGELLGFTPTATTIDVVDKLYAWPSVIRVPARVPAA
jgi:UDP-glucose 4-epimerase